jgi:ABC-type maltose transport system permease subunit
LFLHEPLLLPGVDFASDFLRLQSEQSNFHYLALLFNSIKIGTIKLLYQIFWKIRENYYFPRLAVASAKRARLAEAWAKRAVLTEAGAC